MADHLDVDPAVLSEIAVSLDEASLQVDELSLPGGVDGGIASGDIFALLADVSLDLAEIAGGLEAMSQQLSETQRLYIERDEDAAEALFLAGGS
ncbi:hypothetical protein [Dietzia alimentaria]|uniref:hypothetical protein n=1 Tax=Dietzia alimentaria TaxID=665550 RepID=UPI00029B563F|nr:hypothetical protein [Dietzia alimentaria]